MRGVIQCPVKVAGWRGSVETTGAELKNGSGDGGSGAGDCCGAGDIKDGRRSWSPLTD